MTAARPTRRTYTRRAPPVQPAEAAPVEAVVAQTAPSAARPEMRAEMRPPMRPSLQEAQERARQIFENVDLDSEEDKFALPPNFEPDGWEYEWKTLEVFGKRNPGNEVQMARMGWDPVDTVRHPEMMPVGFSGQITREGMGLFQRPKIVNDRQRAAMYNKAIGQVRGQEAHVGMAPKDTMQRTDSRGQSVGQTGGRVKSEFVAPSSVKDEGFVPVRRANEPIPAIDF